MKKNAPFIWSAECQDSFDLLKNKLISPSILQFPDFDKTFYLATDASNVACGAVLLQKHNDIDLPVAYASKSFTKGESNKSTIEKELTAIHWAICHFKPYLYGRPFVVKTDHRPLVYLFAMKDPSSKLTRMRLDLEEFNFTIEYVKGQENIISDALSRIQVNSEGIKHINILTRAMSSKLKENALMPTHTEPDQLHVYEAVGCAEVYSLKKLSFRGSDYPNSLDIFISNKSYKKKVTIKQGIKLNNKKEQITNLPIIFHALENYFKERLASQIPNRNTMIAIAQNDLLFTYVPVQLFKDIGNSLLKNIKILIYKRPIVLTDANKIRKILKFYHESPINGHLGINRLYRKLKAFYTWESMKKSVAQFVKSCHACILNKSFPTLQTKEIVTTTPSKAFDVVSVDTIGPLPLTQNGNRYAISLQCDLSKFLVLIPIPDKSSTTIAKSLISNVFAIFGPTKGIRTDQGTEYKGIFDEVCQLMKIDHVCGTAYHPQTIGAVERSHRCLNEFLRNFCNTSNTDWDTWLPYFCLSFNTVPNKVHGYTPFELVYGKPSPDVLSSFSTPISTVYNHDSYLFELKQKLQVANKLAAEAINKEKLNRTNNSNLNVVSINLEIGDTVFLKMGNAHKLNAVNSGPFTISKLYPCNAEIMDLKGNAQLVHRSRLLKFK